MRFPSRTIVSSAAIIVLLLAVFAAFPSVAQAHASYDTSTPAANSIMKTPPTQVVMNFKQNVSPNGFNIVVYTTKGVVVSDKPVIEPSNPRRVTVNMTGDDSEVYRVDWQTISAEDGEATLGAFTFTVSKTVAPSSGSTDGTTVTAPPAKSSLPVGTILAVIIGIAVGAGGTYYALRNR